MNHDPEASTPRERPHFQGVELRIGWKIASIENNSETGKRTKPQQLVNWTERTVQDSFADVAQFGADLALSLQNRLDNCVVDDKCTSQFFDIGETFNLLCGEKVSSNRVKIKEGDLEVFGSSQFEKFFREVCH